MLTALTKVSSQGIAANLQTIIPHSSKDMTLVHFGEPAK